ncbi:MAG: helix-turn-helix domain-containing protein [Candidatus Baltobacteraceae bacterium]
MRKVKGLPRRRPGRPARISREAVVEAARRIVEAEGIDGLTMRRVADELGVVPMAIYRHVARKDELVVLLVDAAYRELPEPLLPRMPRTRLIALWVFLHDGLAQFPWVVAAIVRSDIFAPSVLPKMDAILKASVDCGLTIAQAGDAYRVVWQYTVGELMLRSAMLERMKAAAPSMLVRTLLDVDPGALPTLAATARSWFSPPRFLTYEAGLQLVLDGVLPAPPRRVTRRER